MSQEAPEETVEVTLEVAPPKPRIDDPDTAGHWAATSRHRLALCFCPACDSVVHPPRSRCFACGGTETVWREVAPRADLYSWVVVEHAVHRGFPVPYTSVLVELADLPGVRLAGHLPGRPSLRAGMRMTARFEDRDGYTLVRWSPVEGSDG